MSFTRFISICTVVMSFCIIFMGISKAASDNSYIGLQNLRSRTIIYCYNNNSRSAEECASYYETKGYVRFNNIPSRSAKYDFLTVDTYPARRWRNGDTSPRW